MIFVWRSRLLLELVRLEHFLVLGGLVHAQVVEKLAAAGDHAEEAAASRVVLLVLLQVLSKFSNFLCKDSNLHTWRPCVLLVGLVLCNETLFCSALECHGS